MIEASITIPVNQDIPEGEEKLSREEIWTGLLMKAHDAREFVPTCTECSVVDQGDGFIVREACIGGTHLKEFVSFNDNEGKVTFHQFTGPWEGIIVNQILEDKDGNLLIEFYCALLLKGAEAGSEQEKAVKEMFMGDQGYGPAIKQTIATTRKLKKEARLAL